MMWKMRRLPIPLSKYDKLIGRARCPPCPLSTAHYEAVASNKKKEKLWFIICNQQSPGMASGPSFIHFSQDLYESAMLHSEKC